ncbi:MAG: ABC transporter permease [Deltaproteobacteria bacterium]|nr:ABC transporter permease [Deltaproteobacteria bacterium]
MGRRLREIGRGALASKLFSLLMASGIFISILALTLITAISAGTRQEIYQTMKGFGFGADAVLLYSGGGRLFSHRRSAPNITPGDLAAIRRLPFVRRLSPRLLRAETVTSGRRQAKTYLYGVTTAFTAVNDWHPASGHFFTTCDLQRRRKVCLLGRTVAAALFPGQPAPLGETVRIRDLFFTVIGVMETKGRSRRYDMDDRVIIPLSTAAHLLFQEKNVLSVKIVVDDPEKMARYQQELRRLLRRRHRLGAAIPDDFRLITAGTIAGIVNRATNELGTMLLRIMAISLLVSGIIITNITLAGISERTREFGIRRAVGASRGDIIVQVLGETVLVSLAGGLAGLLAGALLCGLLRHYTELPVILTWQPCWLTLLLATGTGLLAALPPAVKAGRLSPREAIQ